MFKIDTSGQLRFAQTLSLPPPAWIGADTPSHPHHVFEHPSEPVFYVPDLGWDVIYVLRAVNNRGQMMLDIVQTFDVSIYGSGPRTGVVASDGQSALDYVRGRCSR